LCIGTYLKIRTALKEPLKVVVPDGLYLYLIILELEAPDETMFPVKI
jgi:hypothetical protein